MGVRVETEAGFVEGVEREGVALFLGVPYAAPPVGEGRFREPLPVQSWTGIRQANSRVSPPQLPMPDLLESDEQAPNDEDCLQVDVYSPGVDSARRPVMVWFGKHV
jgi:para-nitrobenzyl esterase